MAKVEKLILDPEGEGRPRFSGLTEVRKVFSTNIFLFLCISYRIYVQLNCVSVIR